MDTIGSRIKIARNRADLKWTQTKLAKHAGVSQGTIGNIEGGKGRTGLESLADIADALGVRYRWLRLGEEPMIPIDRPWPFPDIDPARFDHLTPNQKIELQSSMRERIEVFERINRDKAQRAA